MISWSAINRTVKPFNLVYDTYEINFCPTRFLNQFALHILFPFSIPFFPNFRAQGYCNSSFSSVLNNWVAPICFHTMVTIFAILPAYEVSGAVFVPVAVYLMHRGMVSLKYAALSSSEYSRVMNCYQDSILNDYSNQLQVLTSLTNSSDQLVQFQIACAASEADMDLNRMYFHVPVASSRTEDDPVTSRSLEDLRAEREALKMRDVWREFTANPRCMCQLEGANQVFGAGLIVSVAGVCFSMLRANSQDYKVTVGKINTTITMIINIIPFLVSAGPATSTLDIVFYITSSIINFFYVYIVLQFLESAVNEAEKKARVGEILGNMLRPQEQRLTQNMVFCRQENALEDLMRSNSAMMSAGGVDGSKLSNLMGFNTQGKGVLRRFSAPTTENSHRNPMIPPVEGGKQQKQQQGSSFNISTESVGPEVDFDAEAAAGDDLEYDRDTNTSDFTRMFGDTTLEDDNVKQIPRVPLHRAQNVYSWLSTRQIMQSYGKRMRFRLDIYVGVIALVLVLLVLTLVLMLALAPSDELRAKDVQTAFFSQTVFLTMALGYHLIRFVLAGVHVNEAYGSHVATLAALVKEAREHYSTKAYLLDNLRNAATPLPFEWNEAAEERKLSEMGRVVEALEMASGSVEKMNAEYSFKLLGLECSYALASSLFSGMGSFLGLVYSVATQKLEADVTNAV